MLLKFRTEGCTFAPAPGDQLLQNSPRAETQQGYAVVAVCLALFLSAVALAKADSPLLPASLNFFSQALTP